MLQRPDISSKLRLIMPLPGNRSSCLTSLQNIEALEGLSDQDIRCLVASLQRTNEALWSANEGVGSRPHEEDHRCERRTLTPKDVSPADASPQSTGICQRGQGNAHKEKPRLEHPMNQREEAPDSLYATVELQRMLPLSDAEVLHRERRRWQHSAQEAWFHQNTHYERWGVDVMHRGAAYRTYNIASRTQTSVSHTKGLCISLNIDPALLGTDEKTTSAEACMPHSVADDESDDGSATVPLFVWQSPASIPGDEDTVLFQLSSRLEEQYDTLAPRALQCAQCPNPSVADLGQKLSDLRRDAGGAKVIFHYCARGVPDAHGGNLYLMSGVSRPGCYSPYTKMPLDILRARVGFPLVFIADCAGAADILKDFLCKRDELDSQQRPLSGSRPVSGMGLDDLADPSRRGTGVSGADMRHSCGMSSMVHLSGNWVSPTTSGGRMLIQEDFLFIGASGSNENGCLAQHPRMPSDILTSCLTTPLRMALLWLMVERADLRDQHPILLHLFPGMLNDKKTPLGQIQWYFQNITDCIAWSTLPYSLFSKLFREDVYVAPLFRGYLLAERIITALGGTVSVYPPLPSMRDHHMWDVLDNALDRACVALLKALRPIPSARLRTFEFREWLDVRATQWKYEKFDEESQRRRQQRYTQKESVTNGSGGTADGLLSGDYISDLPSLEGRQVRLPDFLYEELCAVAAMVERVTQQSFQRFPTPLIGWTNKSGDASPNGGSTCKSPMSPIVGDMGSVTGNSSNAKVPRASSIPRVPPSHDETLRGTGRSVSGYRNMSLQQCDSSEKAHTTHDTGAHPWRGCRRVLSSHRDAHDSEKDNVYSAASPNLGVKATPFEYVVNMYAAPRATATTAPSGGGTASYPLFVRLPMVLQGLLVNAHRDKATELVCRLVDVGPPGVMQCAEANLYRIVLDRYWTRPDLRHLLPSVLFIYAKSCYADPALVGSPVQRDAIIEACVGVLLGPVVLPAPGGMQEMNGVSAAHRPNTELGAWQHEVLGSYATASGQQLLASSLLSLIAMHSEEGRNACHRYGAFQVCCDVLKQEAMTAPMLSTSIRKKHGSNVSMGSSVNVNALPAQKRTHPVGFTYRDRVPHDAVRGCTPSDERPVPLLYHVTLVTLFISLLHDWQLPENPAEGSEEEREAQPLTPDDKTGSLRPTTITTLCMGLRAAREALERFLYSTMPVLRVAALRGMSFVLLAPAPDDGIRTEYLRSLLTRIYEDCAPPFECNTDVRLELIGAVYHSLKFLMGRVGREMKTGEIRNFVVGWISHWSVQCKEGRRPSQPYPDEEPEFRCGPLGFSPFASVAAQGPATTHYSPSPTVSRQCQVPFVKTNESAQCGDTRLSTPPSLRPRRQYSLQAYLASLSNLIRHVIEHVDSVCPYVATHARRIAMENLTFLEEPWFERMQNFSVQSLPMEGGQTVPYPRGMHPTSHPAAGALGVVDPAANTLHERGGPRKCDAGADSRALFGRVFPAVLRVASGNYDDRSTGEGTGGAAAQRKRRFQAGDPDDTEHGYYSGGEGNISSEMGSGPELLHHGRHLRTHTELDRNSLSIRAFLDEDTGSVAKYVYAVLSFLGDLLLVRQDDYDPSHPFNRDKELALHRHMQYTSAALREMSCASHAIGGFASPAWQTLVCDTPRSNQVPASAVGRGDAGASDNSTAGAASLSPRENKEEGGAYVLLCEGDRTDSNAGAIQSIMFHPSKPHAVSCTDQGLLQVWCYGLDGQPFVRKTAQYPVCDVVARHNFATPPNLQLRNPYSSQQLPQDRDNGGGVVAQWESVAAPRRLPNGSRISSPREALGLMGDHNDYGHTSLGNISGLHFIDAAYRTLLCTVRRTGSVEIFSGYENNSTVRRVTSFETMLFDQGKGVHECLSAYHPSSTLLHLSYADGSISSWDVSCEQLAFVGAGRDELEHVPSSLASHPSDPNIFAVGAGPVYLYDLRESSHRAKSVFNSSPFFHRMANTVATDGVPNSSKRARGDGVAQSLPLTNTYLYSLCLHTGFSGRYSHMLVAGYSGETAVVVLWDDRINREPLHFFAARVPGASDALHTIHHMEVHCYSRSLTTLTTTSGSLELAEPFLSSPPRAKPVGAPSLHVPSGSGNTVLPSMLPTCRMSRALRYEPGAALFHPFLPLVGLGRGGVVALYGREGMSASLSDVC